jgi:hypothetical protein
MDQWNRRGPKPLVTVRIIWGAMLMGELMFMVVVLSMISHGKAASAAEWDSMRVMRLASVVLLAACVPMGFVLRRVTYGKYEAGRLDAGKYLTGNILLWAMCEGPCFLGLVVVMLTRRAWPMILVCAVAMGVQALTFPTGGAVEGG